MFRDFAKNIKDWADAHLQRPQAGGQAGTSLVGIGKTFRVNNDSDFRAYMRPFPPLC